MNRHSSVDQLKLAVRQFCIEREWEQFHTEKDLAIAILTETAELLEHFRFTDSEEAHELLHDDASRENIQDEVADILFFLLRFADLTNIPLDEALYAKLKKNAANYPVDKAKGTTRKYDQL